MFKEKLCDDKLSGWNNIVKECKQVQFSDKTFIIVEERSKGKEKGQFYVIDKSKLSDQVFKYLQSFKEGEDSL